MRTAARELKGDRSAKMALRKLGLRPDERAKAPLETPISAKSLLSSSAGDGAHCLIPLWGLKASLIRMLSNELQSSLQCTDHVAPVKSLEPTALI